MDFSHSLQNFSRFFDMPHGTRNKGRYHRLEICLYDIFANCNWVVTRWQ